MALDILRFSSIILTAVAMGAELAHLFALPNTIHLSGCFLPGLGPFPGASALIFAALACLSWLSLTSGSGPAEHPHSPHDSGRS
jgi:hypothetical protein